jgi:hypothetical protein
MKFDPRTEARFERTEELERKREARQRVRDAAPDMLKALEALFEHCAMVHKHWGDGSNQRQADEAIKAAQAAIKKAKGE